MSDKQQVLATLRDMFERWEALLASMREEQITVPQAPSGMSIKDVIAHLRAWQQRSIARMEAALANREPVFPEWPSDIDPDLIDPPDQINAWIYETHRAQPWSQVHNDWRSGFLRFLQLGEAIPADDLLADGKYRWLDGAPLAAVLLGSHEHHAEHLESLLAGDGPSMT